MQNPSRHLDLPRRSPPSKRPTRPPLTPRRAKPAASALARPTFAATLAAAFASALALAGCRIPTFTTAASARFVSAARDAELRPDLDLRGYTYSDPNTADLLLTDLDANTVADPAALARASGQIIHVHMFIRPNPGTTPIESTAITCTVRYVVLAEGRAGVYAGGGFLLPNAEPGGRRFVGRVPLATLSLVAKTDGFVDRLGNGTLSLRFALKQDDELTRTLRRAAERVALAADPVPGLTTDQLLDNYRWSDEHVALATD